MKKIVTLLMFLLFMAFTAARPVIGIEPDEVLDDPVLEARAREISTELRCVVCQNQSIDDSNADIARAMRLLVRERLVAGDNDKEVVNYIVARYGDYVLLRPPFQPNTLGLWLAPPLMAVVIATLSVLFYQTYRRRRLADLGPDPLSPTDRAELDALVDQIASTSTPDMPRSQFRVEIEKGLNPTAGGDDDTAGADDIREDGGRAGNADNPRQT